MACIDFMLCLGVGYNAEYTIFARYSWHVDPRSLVLDSGSFDPATPLEAMQLEEDIWNCAARVIDSVLKGNTISVNQF